MNRDPMSPYVARLLEECRAMPRWLAECIVDQKLSEAMVLGRFLPSLLDQVISEWPAMGPQWLRTHALGLKRGLDQ